MVRQTNWRPFTAGNLISADEIYVHSGASTNHAKGGINLGIQRIVLLSVLTLFVTAVCVTPVFAAKAPPPPTVQIQTKLFGMVTCLADSVQKYEDGSIKQCTLTVDKTITTPGIICDDQNTIEFYPEGGVKQCKLAIDKPFTNPMPYVCDDKTIELYPDGTVKQCTLDAAIAVPSANARAVAKTAISFYPEYKVQQFILAVEKSFAAPLDLTCDANQPIELYPDGALKQCVLKTNKVFATPNLTATAKAPISFYPDGKLEGCTPTEHIYMVGKGTCLPGEPISYYPDAKVKECTYTTPLYQNRSCLVGARASFYPNGQFKDCALPVEKSVGKFECKVEAPVSYHSNGAIASCALATPAETIPGTTAPAGTVVKFDENGKLVVPKVVPAEPTPAQPAAK
jgi:hypothetical protein